MKEIALLVLAILVSGCATPMHSNSVQQDFWGKYVYSNYEINITSDPTGAKIEWNNEYIGITPLQYIYNGSRHQIYPQHNVIVIKAYPIEKGQYLQTKVIYGNQTIPQNIYFNMNLQLKTPTYDININ